MRPMQILIRPRECAGRSESTLGAQMSEGTFSDVAVPMLLHHCRFLSGTRFRKREKVNPEARVPSWWTSSNWIQGNGRVFY